VTDAPEVHSCGYHVSFDLGAHPSLGYILPTWLDQEQQQLQRQLAGGQAAPPADSYAWQCSQLGITCCQSPRWHGHTPLTWSLLLPPPNNAQA
jgi:hypothetical protein